MLIPSTSVNNSLKFEENSKIFMRSFLKLLTNMTRTHDCNDVVTSGAIIDLIGVHSECGVLGTLVGVGAGRLAWQRW